MPIFFLSIQPQAGKIYSDVIILNIILVLPVRFSRDL